jgi:hypothetical protein
LSDGLEKYGYLELESKEIKNTVTSQTAIIKSTIYLETLNPVSG